MCLVESTVLMVGISERKDAIEKLPIKLITLDTGAEAIQCLRNQKIATVVSKWDLIDIPKGQLLRNITGAKPGLPTIAFIRSGDYQQEIAARSIGITAVLSEDVSDDYFRNTVCGVLGLPPAEAIEFESLEVDAMSIAGYAGEFLQNK